MRYLDAGTTYAKILDESGLRVQRTDALPPDFRADAATGHNASRWSETVVNELVALARGGRILAGETFNLIDVGARDMKRVEVHAGRLKACDWNDSCGALCGFSLELLGAHFGLDWNDVQPASKGLHVTCGIFALSEMFDRIAEGTGIPDASALFVKGLADLAHRFAGRPRVFHLSGGLCENPLFLASFDCEVRPLGRGVLLEGLRSEVEKPK